MLAGPGPISGAGQHVAAADDTCASIAKKLGLDAQALVRINKERYPALTKHAKLMADTLLLLPPAGTGDGAPAGDDRSTGKRKRTTEHASGNAGGLKQDGRWPIEVGRLMSTPVSPITRGLQHAPAPLHARAGAVAHACDSGSGGSTHIRAGPGCVRRTCYASHGT